jgi:hypothetical protein
LVGYFDGFLSTKLGSKIFNFSTSWAVVHEAVLLVHGPELVTELFHFFFLLLRFLPIFIADVAPEALRQYFDIFFYFFVVFEAIWVIRAFQVFLAIFFIASESLLEVYG